MRNNLYSSTLVGSALNPQSIAAAGTATGNSILNPKKYGRQLTFILQAGSLTSVTVLTVKIYAKILGGSFAPIPDNSVSPVDLQFTAASAIAAGALDSSTGTAGAPQQGVLLGSLPIDRLPYTDYQVRVITVTGATVLIGCIYIISSLYDLPAKSGGVLASDDLLFKKLPMPAINVL